MKKPRMRSSFGSKGLAPKMPKPKAPKKPRVKKARKKRSILY